MISPRTQSDLVGRRAELMAELFLQELGPQFLSRPTSPDVGYNLLAGFENKRKGINTFAVEVKSTEAPPGPRYQLSRDVYDRISHSNIPGLLLVVDVKHSRLYFSWLDSAKRASTGRVSVDLTEVNDATRKQLQAQLHASSDRPAAALSR